MQTGALTHCTAACYAARTAHPVSRVTGGRWQVRTLPSTAPVPADAPTAAVAARAPPEAAAALEVLGPTSAGSVLRTSWLTLAPELGWPACVWDAVADGVAEVASWPPLDALTAFTGPLPGARPRPTPAASGAEVAGWWRRCPLSLFSACMHTQVTTCGAVLMQHITSTY